MEKELLDQFVRRFAYGMNIKRIDSNGSHTGSPFYFYCEHCGIPTEAFPEEPIVDPSRVCTQCTFISDKNLLNDAKIAAKKFFNLEG